MVHIFGHTYPTPRMLQTCEYSHPPPSGLRQERLYYNTTQIWVDQRLIRLICRWRCWGCGNQLMYYVTDSLSRRPTPGKVPILVDLNCWPSTNPGWAPRLHDAISVRKAVLHNCCGPRMYHISFPALKMQYTPFSTPTDHGPVLIVHPRNTGIAPPSHARIYRSLDWSALGRRWR